MMLYSSIFDGFFDTSYILSGEVWSSLFVIGIIIILCIIIRIQAHFANPLKKPRGLLFLAEEGVKFFDRLVSDMMGIHFEGYGGFIMAIAVYLFISFIFGLTGLPSPITNLAVPLTLALIVFILIHATSVKYTKFKYFKRYVDPFPVMLPINLISMWAPLLSMTLRLFGNALAGWTLMSIVYYGLGNLSAMIFSGIQNAYAQVILPPLITPVLHAYFDLFSGFIQTTIFIFLTMINISNEVPEDIDEILMKGGN